ncbi:PREDICTED: solute carrier family 22 member 5-like [Papilio xuthus]|uniref:Solute carrier family 22 member 1 n=1 Tax=Papilio xuthus TaxID=66420 RepID=A0A0N0P9G0_PAPXU|nr:PREDICTED: solute carrier family 22 member 5-like [Papilio xuthus]KPJ00906.1 Solute carrier family 22 member 1 [Papilio xuthus]
MSGTPGAEAGGAQVDAALARLGSCGPHHMLTLSLLALVYATNAVYNVNYVFAVEEVGYRCAATECAAPAEGWRNGTSLLRAGPERQCRCAHPSTGRDHACTHFIYDNPHSFVAEFSLACEEWKPPLVGTAHMLGNMVGLLLQGQISDRFGRKAAAVGAGGVGAALGLAKSWAPSFWPYVALEGLEAALGDAFSPIFMLSIEMVEKRRAVLYQMILLNCYTGGLVALPFVARAVPYWRSFLRLLYAPTLLILTYSFFLDESIRWLFSKGKREEAIKLIQKIARRNNVKVDDALLTKLEYGNDDSAPQMSDRRLLIKTFRSKIMLQRFAVCTAWWFTITLINYGMMISAVLIDGDKYLNFALLMLMDVPANLLCWLALARCRRRLPLIISFTLGGLFCILHSVLLNGGDGEDGAGAGYAWAGLALFMAFETLATFSYNIVYTYTSELFPTYTRNSLHALCASAGRLGALLAPQMPLLMTYWSGLPAMIFGVTSLASGALTLLMPETAGTRLPDTIREAENIGKNCPVEQEEQELKASGSPDSAARKA